MKRKFIVMIVSDGIIISIMMISSHLSENGNLIFASAYPARPFTIMPSTISSAAYRSVFPM